MSCTDCFNGCGAPTPDTCVKYTGESVECLGIETGDPLSKVEEILFARMCEYAKGEGIVFEDFDAECNFFRGILGCCSEPSLINIIKALIEANCTLYDMVKTVETNQNPSFVYTLGCIADMVPASPTINDIVQAIITKLCSVSAKTDTIYADYVKASDLNSLIASYLVTYATSAQQYTKMVPYVAYEYYGPLSNFDGSGNGLPAFGYDKVYLCVGQTKNGYTLPDKRGRVAVGVPSMPGGGALPAAVDYALPINAACNYTLKQQFGENYNQMSVNQLPAHTHTPTVTDPQHSHFVASNTDLGGVLNSGNVMSSSHSTGGNLGYTLVSGVGNATIGRTNSVSTNISVAIANTGNGNPIDNRQPSVAAYYIMYIP